MEGKSMALCASGDINHWMDLISLIALQCLTYKLKENDMFPFLNTFKRLISKQQETHTAPQKYSNDQLIQWATGCMLEGLPDDFYQARLLCTRQSDPENPDGWIVNVNHDVMLNPDSEYERFQPADDLYPTQGVEMLLDGKEWSNASITSNKENASFKWS